MQWPWSKKRAIEALDHSELKKKVLVAYVSLCQILAQQYFRQTCDKEDVDLDENTDLWARQLIERLMEHLGLSKKERLMIVALTDASPVDTHLSIIFEATSKSKIDVRFPILENLFLISLAGGTYDARSRSLLFSLAALFQMTTLNTTLLELHASETLQIIAASSSSPEKHKHQEAHDTNTATSTDVTTVSPLSLSPTALASMAQKSKLRRVIYTSIAAISGGIVVGVTGGLAAPLVGAGLASVLGAIGIGGTAAFLSSIGGVALITSVFGVTGAGLSSYRMAKRVKEVEEFEFLVNYVDVVVPERNNHEGKKKGKEKKREEEDIIPPFVTVTVPGWINRLEDVTAVVSCMTVGKGTPIYGELYTLKWETQALLNLGRALEKFLTTETAGMVAAQALKTTFVAGLMSAMVWPASLLKIGQVVDNPWSIASDRAQKSVLAEVISSEIHGHRPIRLIGISFGARVIYYCLQTLLKSNQRPLRGVIDSVVFIGAPFTTSYTEMKQLSRLVSGRIVNAYCTSDWALGFFMRASAVVGGMMVAGLGPIAPNKGSKEKVNDDEDEARWLENVNITEIVQGHRGYSDGNKMKQVLQKCGILHE